MSFGRHRQHARMQCFNGKSKAVPEHKVCENIMRPWYSEPRHHPESVGKRHQVCSSNRILYQKILLKAQGIHLESHDEICKFLKSELLPTIEDNIRRKHILNF